MLISNKTSKFSLALKPLFLKDLQKIFYFYQMIYFYLYQMIH